LHIRLIGRLRPYRLQLTPGHAVDDVPPARTKLLTQRVGRFEVPGVAAFDPRLEKPLSFGLIRAFWL